MKTRDLMKIVEVRMVSGNATEMILMRKIHQKLEQLLYYEERDVDK